MPATEARAAVARHSRPRSRHALQPLRLAVGAILALSILSFPGLADPAPAAAGSSCTGWTSTARPPQTIRVLRTRSGRIEKVDFRQYVAEVMASGEWPSRLRMATLEAGALATKQYAWYYSMKGHHRSYYRRGGRCYDVRDDVRDQLYRPERARPTARQWRAINSTWNLTLRKNGRFFLTGYRYGATNACAADANGWKLYEKSIEACARRGWSSRRILDHYLSPNLAFVWSDRAGPVVQNPGLALRVGSEMPGAVTLDWRPVRHGPSVASYRLQRKIGKQRWERVKLTDPTAVQAEVWLKPGARNRFRVKAVDGKGRSGPWAYSVTRTPLIRGPVGRTLASGSPEAASGETRQARTRFRGRAVALVMPTGPDMGEVTVSVNGKRVATVDLQRDARSGRKLVWAKNWPKSRTRTVKVTAVSPAERVDFEGFYILR